ncbi:MAG: hypothetical protein GTO05_02990 [Gemmatimonadales bacterium]|nr:hypothetical protein [Gemmatimonadales bacterium]
MHPNRSGSGMVRVALLVAGCGLGALGVHGCVVAAAGAGAAAGIHVTSQGAEAQVSAGIERTATAVRETFRELGIRQTGESSEQSGAEREFKGEVDDLDVTVKLRTKEGGTQVEVSARRSLASWDKEYARRVVGRIVQRSG